MITVYNKWQHNKYIPHYASTINKRHLCIIMLQDNNIIGFVEQLYNWYHPYHNTFNVTCLLSNYSIVYSHCIAQLCRFNNNVKISFVTTKNKALESIVLAYGFKKRRQCFEDNININTLNTLTHLQLSIHLNTFKNNKVPLLVKKYIVQEYRTFHYPVSPLNNTISTLYMYQNMYQKMIEHASFEHSFYAIFKNKPMYFITEIIDNHTVFTSYMGGNVTNDILLIFYKQCIQQLLQLGITTISYELDDINTKQMVFAQLVHLPSASYDTYIFEK